MTEWLENRIRFSGSCYYIFEAIKTSYFVERYVTDSLDYSNLLKDIYIQNLLQKDYNIIRKRYYEIVQDVENKEGFLLVKIANSHDKDTRKEEYIGLQRKIGGVVSLVSDLRTSLQKQVDAI